MRERTDKVMLAALRVEHGQSLVEGGAADYRFPQFAAPPSETAPLRA